MPWHRTVDLLAGSGNTQIATLIVRWLRFTTMVKMDSKETPSVVRALQHHVFTLPR